MLRKELQDCWRAGILKESGIFLPQPHAFTEKSHALTSVAFCCHQNISDCIFEKFQYRTGVSKLGFETPESEKSEPSFSGVPRNGKTDPIRVNGENHSNI
jgi:hypothetical protein